MKFNYSAFEEQLELLLGRGLIEEWRGLGPGHYRINGELDVWPRRRKFNYFLTWQHGEYNRLEDLL